jgi:subtilase family serine protease
MSTSNQNLSKKLKSKKKKFSLQRRSNTSLPHKIVIVCKRKNVDLLKQKVDEITDPEHENYNQHLTSEQIQKLTYQQESINYVINFLISNNIEIDSSSINSKNSNNNNNNNNGFNSHLITATASIAVWENIFNNKFYEFELKNNYNKNLKKNNIHRALEYSLPKHLSPHIEFVHYLIHFPSIVSTTTTNSISKIQKKTDSNDAINNENKNKNYQNSLDANYLSASITGYVYPQFLFDYYKIANQTGNLRSTQAFFGTFGQVYNPTDLQMFQEMYGLRVQKLAGTYNDSIDVTTDFCISSSANGNCNIANLDV